MARFNEKFGGKRLKLNEPRRKQIGSQCRLNQTHINMFSMSLDKHPVRRRSMQSYKYNGSPTYSRRREMEQGVLMSFTTSRSSFPFPDNSLLASEPVPNRPLDPCARSLTRDPLTINTDRSKPINVGFLGHGLVAPGRPKQLAVAAANPLTD